MVCFWKNCQTCYFPSHVAEIKCYKCRNTRYTLKVCTDKPVVIWLTFDSVTLVYKQANKGVK